MDLGGDSFLESWDVRDDADEFPFLVKFSEGFDGGLQRFFIQGSKSFIEKEGIDTDLLAGHAGKAEGKGEADDEALAA